MKLFASVVPALMLVSAPNATPTAEMRGIEIVSYGIYAADLESAKRDKQGVIENVSANVHLQSQTATIPIKSGIRFGIEYKVTGAPAGTAVMLRKVTVYPPDGIKSPSVSEPLYRNEESLNVKIGEQRYSGYRLDDAWEMVPGEWHIQLWTGDKKLADQTFTLVAQ